MIVCKFGGSSLSSAARIRRAAALFGADARRRFIVVSAPGARFEGDEKTTDLLLRACEGDESALEAALQRFGAIASALNVDLRRELRRAEAEIPAADKDYAASRGEFLTALLFARFAHCEFVDAAELIRIGEDGAPDVSETYARMQRRLKPLARAVIPGFYASLPDGRIRTFSRGGSDVTGALVAGAMAASLYENWTDVDGLMSADPRLVPDTVCVPEVSYRQMRLLSAMGAQVLHPDSLRPVMRAGIPTQIRNSFRPKRPGTRIDTGVRASIPCITGRTLENGEAAVAVLAPDAMALPGPALAALKESGVRVRRLCAQTDHLTLRVLARDFPRAVRALHGEFVTGKA